MEFNFEGDAPLYQQVADEISDGIFKGIYKEGTQIPSTTEISKMYKINPATILKGMNLLVQENVIEKKRGIGMFVKSGAQKMILESRKLEFINYKLHKFLEEAEMLRITQEELIKLIEKELTQ